MKNIVEIYKSHAELFYIVVAVIIFGIIGWLIINYFRKKNSFINSLKKAVHGQIDNCSEIYRITKLIRKNSLVIKLLKNIELEHAQEILLRIGLTKQWIDTIKVSPNKRYFTNILDFYIKDGLFPCFKLALARKSYKNILIKSIDKYKIRLPLITIAQSGNGEDFNGKKALDIFKDRKEEIKDILGDPNWRGRFFALKILINDRDETTKSHLLELFTDPNPLIRKSIVKEFEPLDTENYKKILFDIIIKDPNQDVRQEAINRYRKDYDEYPKIDINKLRVEEKIHFIQALRLMNKDDEGIATELLLNNNAEIRFHAACYLNRSGTLNRYCTKLDISDREDINRKITILKQAASAGVTDFLKILIDLGTRESLLVASDILKYKGDKNLIHPLLKKAIQSNCIDVYMKAVDATVERKSEEDKYILKEEIYKNINNRELLSFLIEKITPLCDSIFIDPLIEVLKKREDLLDITKNALLSKDEDALTSKLIEIIKEKGGADLSFLKVQALFILGKLKKEYCLSFIFENLSILPVKFVKDFAEVLKQFPKEILIEKIGYYLNQVDGEIRANIIALIPIIGITNFNKELRRSLNDADPLVRIASTFALVDMGDTRSFNQALMLLRDPVEEVRNHVAFALGRTGKSEILDEIAKIFYDENETIAVKRSIIHGISESKNTYSTGILIDFLEKDTKLNEVIMEKLKNHSEESNIKILIERMKDGNEPLKEKISNVFIKMRLKSKPVLLHILESEFVSLKDYASNILDIIEGTEEEIKKLKHKNPLVRREASKNLSLIGTNKAFRGLIMASRDPDKEVRVNVVKALEKLETEDGKEILKSLEEDPDAKIRRYTHWALERLKTKEIV